MNYLRLLGLTLLAVFALGALIAASASAALPELLGGKVFPQTWTGKSVGEPKLVTLSGLVLTCKAATADGEQTSDTLGVYHLRFTGCGSSLGGKCNTEADSEADGVILVLGEYHYVDDFLGTAETLGVAILFVLNAGFVCHPLFTVALLVTGHLLCLILKPLESNVTHEFHCTQTNGTTNEKHWWNDSGVEQTAVLLSDLNEGAFEESGLQWLGTMTYAEKVAFMNH